MTTEGGFDWGGARRVFLCQTAITAAAVLVSFVAFAWALLVAFVAVNLRPTYPRYGPIEVYFIVWLGIGMFPASGPGAWLARWGLTRPSVRGPDAEGRDLHPDHLRVLRAAEWLLARPARYLGAVGIGVALSAASLAMP